MKLPGPAVMPNRPRWIHWLAWAASIVALAILVAFLTGRGDPSALAAFDLVLSIAFALEFVTRSGLRQRGWRYVAWRWFDFFAIVPAVWLAEASTFPTWAVWGVGAARLGRLLDRTLGDGFAQRQLVGLLNALEEEISDRVVVKVLVRVEAELAHARFGQTAAEAFRKNKEAVLKRIYEEQLADESLMGRVAQFTGLQSALERAEARIFDAVIELVGSPETDQLIRDLVRDIMQRARAEIGTKSWRLGTAASAAPS